MTPPKRNLTAIRCSWPGPGRIAISPALYKSLPYDPQKDFTPIALIAKNPFVLIVNPALPIQSVPDLIKYAKEHPGSLTYGSGGVGSPHQLFAEMFKTLTGIEMTHVPYKGTAPALTDLIAGHISLIFADLRADFADGHSREGAGAWRDLRRADCLRRPTFRRCATQACRDSTRRGGAWSWRRRTHPVRSLPNFTKHSARCVADEKVRKQMIALGMVPQSSPPPDKLQDFIDAEQARWGQVVKDAGLAGSE